MFRRMKKLQLSLKSWSFAVNVGKMSGFSNVLFLHITINEAEKDWGLQCLHYEISKFIHQLVKHSVEC
ncbi:hypothetical protein Hanom_Chr02g00118651 [Helianthus anomalus]